MIRETADSAQHAASSAHLCPEAGASMQDWTMGYSVTLARGLVVIPPTLTEPAIDAVRRLDEHNDLKGGWTRITNPDGTFGRRPHWSFTTPGEIESAQSLVEMLRAFRYLALSSPDGEIYEVQLIGGTRSMSDDLHLWRALAPYVNAGGELLWLGEDDVVHRWRFDGSTLAVAQGRMNFSSTLPARVGDDNQIGHPEGRP